MRYIVYNTIHWPVNIEQIHIHLKIARQKDCLLQLCGQGHMHKPELSFSCQILSLFIGEMAFKTAPSALKYARGLH